MTNQTDRIRRNTSFSVVLHIRDIRPHPDPVIQRLELLDLSNGVTLVTGKHYRAGDRGIYIRPGCLIPGWLAEQLWLVGKKRAHAWFEVRSIPIGFGDGVRVESPGLWCGQFYKHDTSAESLQHWSEMRQAGGAIGRGTTRVPPEDMDWIEWPFWREGWVNGNMLDGHLGIVEAVEQDHVVRQPITRHVTGPTTLAQIIGPAPNATATLGPIYIPDAQKQPE
jgi:hypothetical protein